jgi:hypothetical protein
MKKKRQQEKILMKIVKDFSLVAFDFSFVTDEQRIGFVKP